MTAEGWIALGSLLVTGLTVWLGYRERAAGHRDALYSRQIDAHVEISHAAGELFGAAAAAHFELGDDVVANLNRADDAFAAAQRKWAPILPTTTTEALDAFYTEWAELWWSGGSGFEAVESRYAGLVRVMRESLSVEPLTEATLRLTGQRERQKRSDRDRRAAVANAALAEDARRAGAVLRKAQTDL